jgi:hypothetical protein
MKALNAAEEVIFVGYSLPSADVAIRTLINPLKSRIEKNEVKVTVVIGEGKTNDQETTWKNFLGNTIEIKKSNAEAYFCNAKAS